MTTGDPPGSRIGDYRLERELRRDDTSIVYEAVHLVLPRRAAVKVAHPVDAHRAAVRLLREACVLEALAHPGVPRVFECGVLADKRPWCARELISGTTLAESLQTGTMAIADLVVMMRAVAEVLDYAHGRGVCHQRLGEATIVRTPDRSFPYCVRGWGGVVAHDSSRVLDASCDIRALGVVAYRALTGTAPTPSSSAQIDDPVAPLELTALVDHMLMADPRSRPSAAEVRQRAAWLAETLELVPVRARWTPPHGLDDRVVAEPEPSSFPDFVIRIHQPR